MAASSTTCRMWRRLSGAPGGTRLFPAAAMVRVPYFASIVPHGTVHAIASRNAGEVAMGMLMEATVPTTRRVGTSGAPG